MKNIKKCIIPFSLAFLQWILWIVLKVDSCFFVTDGINLVMIAERTLFLIFLIGLWYLGYYVISQVLQKKPVFIRGLFVFIAYFAISCIILLIIWPGTWSCSDIGVLRDSRMWCLNSWQNFLSSIFQILFLQLFPCPGGVILVQNLVISIIVAYIVTNIEITFFDKWISSSSPLNKVIRTIIEFIPFVLPPILMYQFSGYRMGLYIYLELALCTFFICSWKRKKKWTIFDIFGVIIVSAIVSVWRTEAFVYVPFVIFGIFVQKKSSISMVRKVTTSFLVVVSFACLFECQSFLLGNSNYNIVSTLSPCIELVRVADKEEDIIELEKINNVINIDVIYQNGDIAGGGAYHRGDVVKDTYTEKEYDEYISSLVKLSLKYPSTIIDERLNMFVDSTGFRGTQNRNNVAQTAALYDNPEDEDAKMLISWDCILNYPIIKDVRSSVIRIFGCATNDSTEVFYPAYWYYNVIWNYIIPLVLLLIFAVIWLIRKRFYLFLSVLPLITKEVAVIITQPSPWIMYHLSVYILGYCVLVLQILYVYYKKIN